MTVEARELEVETRVPRASPDRHSVQTHGMNDTAIQVTATGWYFVRAVAMTFDRYLQSDKVRERFSRII